MNSRYYIVNFTDASLLRTDSVDRAYELAASDEMLVIDTQAGGRLNADARITQAFDCDAQKEMKP